MDETQAPEPTVDERLARIFDAPQAVDEPADEGSDSIEGADSVEGADTVEGSDSVEGADTVEGADDGEEVEYEGKAYKVPKELKNALLRQQDYTVKTQEAAAIRRQAEDKAQFLEAREQLLAAAYEDAAEYRALQMQQKQYEALDWGALYSADPGQALKLRDQRDQLTAKIQEKEKQLQQRAAQNEQIRSAHLAKQLEIGRAELQRRVGALTDADRQATIQQAKALGFEESELGRITDARVMHALVELARLKAKAEAGAKVIEKKVAQAKPISQTARSAPQTQRDSSFAQARQMLRKTGRDDYAERVLNAMFKE